jgi:hypothetical protein
LRVAELHTQAIPSNTRAREHQAGDNDVDVDVGGCIQHTLVLSPVLGRQLHPRANTRIGTTSQLPLDHLNHVPVPSTALCPLVGCLEMCLYTSMVSRCPRASRVGYKPTTSQFEA